MARPAARTLIAGLVTLAFAGCGGRADRSADDATAASGGTAVGGSGGSGGTSGAGTGGVGGTSGGGTGGTGLSDSADGVVGCELPRPYVTEANGYESCGYGKFLHRPAVAKCELTPVRTEPVLGHGDCTTDLDCASVTNGRCVSSGSPPRLVCISSCVTDSECPAGQACLCDSEVNHCVPSDCASDADCGSGLLCASYQGVCHKELAGFACQLPDDECTADCGEVRACTTSGYGRSCVSAGGCGAT